MFSHEIIPACSNDVKSVKKFHCVCYTESDQIQRSINKALATDLGSDFELCEQHNLVEVRCYFCPRLTETRPLDFYNQEMKNKRPDRKSVSYEKKSITTKSKHIGLQCEQTLCHFGPQCNSL